jgi:transcriptional regulator of acetoin/glycerol metabolism
MTIGFDAHVAHVIATVANPEAAARSRLVASWSRSLNCHKLDPARRHRTERLGQRQLQQLRQSEDALLAVASQALDHLTGVVQMSGCVVALADARGRILDHRCRDADTHLFESLHLVAGGDWSEAAEGTNGIGTCLREARQVTIHRDEHFLARNIVMTCLGAPVHGADGALVAAVDVSSLRDDQTTGMNSLMTEAVAQAARRIELGLLRRAFPEARMTLAVPDAPMAGYLAVDADDVVVGATQAARRHCELAQTGRVTPRPLRDMMGQASTRSGFETAEHAVLKQALLRAGGNVSEAARALGIGRATLYRRMKRVGMNAAARDMCGP